MLRALAALACAGLIAGCSSSNFDPYSGAPRSGSSLSGPPTSRDSMAGGPAVITAPPVVAGPAGCAAGREAEARTQLATVKSRYGYR